MYVHFQIFDKDEEGDVQKMNIKKNPEVGVIAGFIIFNNKNILLI